YAGVLKKNLGEDKRAQEYALEIEKAGRSAASLIRQLLAFSRQQVMSPTDLNLNTMISDMDKMVRRLLGEDITVSLALHPELGSVQADPSQIQQVILNLAANARDAMPRGGMLEIETRNVELDESYTRDHAGSSAGEYVLLAIRDTGTGMSPEVVAHIFEPFFTTKEVGKGTGLGLATVYGIVKQSRGYIWVDSAPGKGSTFQIYLPRHGGAEVTSAGKPPTEALEKSRGSETVLLVEDSEPLRNLARSFLEAHGYRVLAAGGGEEALEAAARHPGIIDMLVTDVVMPGINGRVLAERLAARQPGLKVLFISGYTDAFIAGHGVLQPGTNLLHKPFSEEAFLNKVREVLQSGASPHGEQNNDLQPAKAG
ncbi:MAG TPA: ATP-binding protein, partial [Methylomirabilota bacterium]|nr:ATP-binding protein [Methylomirabilota bacterium]